MTELHCRALREDDLQALERVVEETGLFPPEMLRPMVAGYLQGGDDLWRCLTADGAPVGLAFCQPEDMADRVWNMRAIAVRPDAQGRGGGAALVSDAETALRDRDARLMIVDTSGDAAFNAARRLYRGCGYREEARIRDFWADGDDKVTFTKAL